MGVELLRQKAGVPPQAIEFIPPASQTSSCDTSQEYQRLHENEQLQRYSVLAWRSMENLTCNETGLVADMVNEYGTRSLNTSPTNIAMALLSAISARELGVISDQDAHTYLLKAMKTLGSLEMHEGFFYNWYDSTTGEKLAIWPSNDCEVKPFLSTVDNGWLAAALLVVKEAEPECAELAENLLSQMDFGMFYSEQEGQLYGGYEVDTRNLTPWRYEILNTEARIATYVGIAKGDLPPEHYFRLCRAFPSNRNQKQVPVGEMLTYHGSEVFEGHYYDRNGVEVIPSWGGSMFETLMPTLLVPEEVWGRNSWGINHPRYVNAHIEHGNAFHGGYWGFSPCLDPSAGYREFGLPELGTFCNGYDCGSRQNHICKEGVITPHAIFLAYRFFPKEALRQLGYLEERFPQIATEQGFYDSVNVYSGEVARSQLSLDQGMSMASLGSTHLREYFGRSVEHILKPLLEEESFFPTSKVYAPSSSGFQNP